MFILYLLVQTEKRNKILWGKLLQKNKLGQHVVHPKVSYCPINACFNIFYWLPIRIGFPLSLLVVKDRWTHLFEDHLVAQPASKDFSACTASSRTHRGSAGTCRVGQVDCRSSPCVSYITCYTMGSTHFIYSWILLPLGGYLMGGYKRTLECMSQSRSCMLGALGGNSAGLPISGSMS